MLYSYILSVALLMDLFVLCVSCLTMFVNCLVKQFAICLGVVVILLLNIMEGCVVRSLFRMVASFTLDQH